MEVDNKAENLYLKRWQLYKSEKGEKNEGRRSLKSRRQTICIGEDKPSSRPEDMLVCQSVEKGAAKSLKRSSVGPKAFLNKQFRFSTSSSKPVKPAGGKTEKGTTLMPARQSLNPRYVASRTDSNLTKLREEARKSRKNTEPVIETCEYKLNDFLATSMNFGTPNTVRVPPLLKKVPERRCLTERNGRLPVQEPSKMAVAQENSKPVPTLSGKKKSLYKCKETSSLRKKTHIATGTKPRFNSIDRRKTTGQCKSMPTTVRPHDENATTKETARQEILGQLNSAIEECSILLDSDCPPDCILPWLKEIEQKIPMCFQSADFWMLKARVHFLLKDVDQLFEVFGNAMKYKATPADVIAESLPKMIKELVSSKEKSDASPMMMTPVRGGADCTPYTPSQTPYDSRASPYNLDNGQYADTPRPGTTPGHYMRSFDSSNIKYLVRKSTPFKKRSSILEEDTLLVTPIRRTNRRSVVSARKSRLDIIIDSLDDCILGDKTNVLYKDNHAILL